MHPLDVHPSAAIAIHPRFAVALLKLIGGFYSGLPTIASRPCKRAES
jgi:hypothetical protein